MTAVARARRRWVLLSIVDRSRVDALDETIDSQRREIAALEIGRRVDREAQLEVQRMLGELQSQVARQNQDLEFYRAVLAKEFGAGAARLQSVAIRRAPGDGGFVVEIAIVRPSARDRPIQGAVRLGLSGTRAGALVELPMRELTVGRQRQVLFSIRNFETVRLPVVVPHDVRPGALTIELTLPPSSRLEDRKVVSWAVSDR
jgi:hypothetical protein